MFASAVQEVVVPETATPVTPPVVTAPVVVDQLQATGDAVGSTVIFTGMILALVFALPAIPTFALATKMVMIPGVNDRQQAFCWKIQKGCTCNKVHP